MPVTAFYAGILALILIALAVQVGMGRLRGGVSILHGEDMDLATRIRRHANFTEAVPMPLILMGAIEVGGASTTLIHGLGIALVACRILHPLGLHHDRMNHPLRGIGAAGTTLVTLIAALVGIGRFL